MAGVVILVILGAVVIDRGRGSDERASVGAPGTTAQTTTTTTATTTEGAEADPADPADVERDLCQILTLPIAERIADMELQLYESSKSRNERCFYASRPGDDRNLRVFLNVHTDPSDEPEVTCDPACQTSEEPVPTLPDGQVVLMDGWAAGEEPDSSRAMWVRWTAADVTWSLWYDPTHRPGVPTLDLKQAYVEAAEEIHQMIERGDGVVE